MKATIKIEKSFDGTQEFSKEWENGDIELFMKLEGEYVDKLCKVIVEKGHEGDDFEIIYKIKVTK